ncbi:MAG: GNAT family protein [Candidatus Absconditabacteria bacterium]|nr:GNAT family protein [Candidatus Absconditabacteria bacterium]MDD3868696.1 GNAT family protein [Candidatus Absconditabacteria bacterium]MDD4714386.1 GNAT family protein [Candidatus Absconditabacteria bacterium]
MKYFPKVMGEKIYLSPLNVEDAEKLTAWMNDPEIAKNITSQSKVISLNSERARIEAITKTTDEYTFAIIEKSENKILGTIGFAHVNWVHRNAEIGISIGEKEYHGKGYGTDAMKSIVSYGFNVLNLHSLYLNVYDFNVGGQKCYQKCGFKVIGKRREGYFYNGKYHDMIYMDITRKDRETLGEK